MARRRPLRQLAPLALLPLAALLAWRLAVLDRTGPGRDVVLVMIDTLRADHLGARRHDGGEVTPELDRLARRGARFADAWSTAPWTPPSTMSLMTSLLPDAHGLDFAGDGWSADAIASAPRPPTLAEILKRLGYRTLAVTAGGGVSADFGFARGFDRYYEPRPRPPEDVAAGVDRALAWLAEPSATPTFLFFHTYEVHLPNTHGPGESGGTPAERAVAAYDRDLSAADRELGRLFAALDRRAIVVVTADHGENLHDRTLAGRPVEHGHHLYPELLRVPLVFVAPGLVPSGRTIGGPVQTIDVLPTLLSLLDAPALGTRVAGRDLRSVLQARRLPDLTRELYFSAPLQGPSWRALRTRDETFIVAPRTGGANWWDRVELPARAYYDRRDDPGEREDRAAERPDRVRELAERLARRAAREADLAPPPPADAAPPPIGDPAATLRALGYLAGGAPTTDEPPRPDGH